MLDMTSTTIDHAEHTITITTTLELPRSCTFPIASPVVEPMNTAAAVRDLYADA